MDWQQIEGSWEKYLVAAKTRWSKISEEQLKATRGRYQVLCARVRDAYGLSPQQAEFQIAEWQSRQPAR